MCFSSDPHFFQAHASVLCVFFLFHYFYAWINAIGARVLTSVANSKIHRFIFSTFSSSFFFKSSLRNLIFIIPRPVCSYRAWRKVSYCARYAAAAHSLPHIRSRRLVELAVQRSKKSVKFEILHRIQRLRCGRPSCITHFISFLCPNNTIVFNLCIECKKVTKSIIFFFAHT